MMFLKVIDHFFDLTKFSINLGHPNGKKFIKFRKFCISELITFFVPKIYKENYIPIDASLKALQIFF